MSKRALKVNTASTTPKFVIKLCQEYLEVFLLLFSYSLKPFSYKRHFEKLYYLKTSLPNLRKASEWQCQIFCRNSYKDGYPQYTSDVFVVNPEFNLPKFFSSYLVILPVAQLQLTTVSLIPLAVNTKSPEFSYIIT
jgi:hypothetical protein